MSDNLIQWIVVGAIIALCVWRAIGSVTARRKSHDAPSGCDDGNRKKASGGGCDGCPLSGKCNK